MMGAGRKGEEFQLLDDKPAEKKSVFEKAKNRLSNPLGLFRKSSEEKLNQEPGETRTAVNQTSTSEPDTGSFKPHGL